MSAVNLKGIPIVRNQAYVTTNETCESADVFIHGFDEPIRINILGIKDLKTNQFRSFKIDVKTPKEMKARFRRCAPEQIIVP